MSKIAIKGADTGTGVFTLESPATNTDRTLVLPDEAGTVLTTAGVPSSAMPAGSVLQVVTVNKTDTTSTTSSSFVDVAGMSLSITPLSTASKVLVIAAFQWGHSNDDDGHSYLNIVRNSTIVVPTTNISSSSGANIVGNFFGRQMLTGTIVAYDSPASVSALTYKLQWRTTSSTVYLNRSGRDANNANYDGRATSSLTVLEIAG